MTLTIPPTVTARAFARLRAINNDTTRQCLRVAVLGGGCSGFQYDITLIDTPETDDIIIASDGQRVVIDTISLPFLHNATIDFKEELIGARFIVDNPNATSSCGCGTSFSL